MSHRDACASFGNRMSLSGIYALQFFFTAPSWDVPFISRPSVYWSVWKREKKRIPRVSFHGAQIKMY